MYVKHQVSIGIIGHIALAKRCRPISLVPCHAPRRRNLCRAVNHAAMLCCTMYLSALTWAALGGMIDSLAPIQSPASTLHDLTSHSRLFPLRAQLFPATAHAPSLMRNVATNAVPAFGFYDEICLNLKVIFAWLFFSFSTHLNLPIFASFDFLKINIKNLINCCNVRNLVP